MKSYEDAYPLLFFFGKKYIKKHPKNKQKHPKKQVSYWYIMKYTHFVQKAPKNQSKMSKKAEKEVKKRAKIGIFEKKVWEKCY